MLTEHNIEYSNKEKELITNIYEIDLLETLRKETLSFNFVLHYILNEKYQITRKEKDITVETVMAYQPHLYDIFKKYLDNSN